LSGPLRLALTSLEKAASANSLVGMADEDQGGSTSGAPRAKTRVIRVALDEQTQTLLDELAAKLPTSVRNGRKSVAVRQALHDAAARLKA
jgi:hypothetical protein